MKREIDRKLALEMAMQDVIDNLEDLSYASGYTVGEACFEILGIDPTELPDTPYGSNRPAQFRNIFEQRAEIVRLRVA